jgi:hypothetical protein
VANNNMKRDLLVMARVKFKKNITVFVDAKILNCPNP